MSFIALNQENGLCGYETSLVNTAHVSSVAPIVGANKWFVQSSKACLRLNDGTSINVKETVEAIMEMLTAAKLLQTGKPEEVVSLPDAAFAIHELTQRAAAAW